VGRTDERQLRFELPASTNLLTELATPATLVATAAICVANASSRSACSSSRVEFDVEEEASRASSRVLPAAWPVYDVADCSPPPTARACCPALTEQRANDLQRRDLVVQNH
jgi:hypothetical protein